MTLILDTNYTVSYNWICNGKNESLSDLSSLAKISKLSPFNYKFKKKKWVKTVRDDYSSDHNKY